MSRPRLVLRIELDSGRLGHGKVELLEQIRDGQSLAAAARAMGMSYKRAWDLLATLNEMFDQPVTVSHPGRTKAGATTLTAFGERLIALYRGIEQHATRAALRELHELAAARASRIAARRVGDSDPIAEPPPARRRQSTDSGRAPTSSPTARARKGSAVTPPAPSAPKPATRSRRAR